MRIVDLLGVNPATNPFQVRFVAGGGVQARVSALDSNSAGSVILNQWTHVAGVFESTASRIGYFDGVAGAANTSNSVSSGIDRIMIGAGNNFGNPAGYYDGSIAELGIWSAALSPTEIKALSNGFTPSQIRPQSLVFYAPLVRDLMDERGLQITAVNAPAATNHPRVYT